MRKTTPRQDSKADRAVREENIFLLRQCIADARHVLNDEKMMDMQSHVLSVAIALFKQRAASVTRQGGE